MNAKTIRDNNRLLIAQLKRKREKLLHRPLTVKEQVELDRINAKLLALGAK